MRLFPTTLAFLLLTTPVFADWDDLHRDLGIVPGNPVEPGLAFNYAAPDRGAPIQSSVWPANDEFGLPMLQPGQVKDATGVDFGEIEAVFETGLPPDTLYILHGTDGFASLAAAVLGAKDFTQSAIDGFTVMSHGEDNAMNFTERSMADPFMGRLGRSYRLAVGGTNAIVSHSDSVLAKAIEDFNAESCATCAPWRDLLSAAKEASGPFDDLAGATGFAGAALQNPRPAIPGDETLGEPTGLSPYGFVMMVATRSEEGGKAHVAVLFASREDAANGAKIIIQGLPEILAQKVDYEPKLTWALSGSDLGVVATITAEFPDSADAARTYLNWLNLSFGAKFAPLFVTQPVPQSP